jgi:hypothetical protein
MRLGIDPAIRATFDFLLECATASISSMILSNPILLILSVAIALLAFLVLSAIQVLEKCCEELPE